MSILLYQLLIAGSLLAVRVLASDRLLPACLIWSALTLFNVFWPPLIVIQLMVIWVTYGLLQPAEKKATSDKTTAPASRSAGARALPGKPAINRRPVTFSTPEPLRPISQPAAQSAAPAAPLLAATFTQWDDSEARAEAVRSASAPLLAICFEESTRIEHALELALSRVERETRAARDPQFAALFEFHRAQARERVVRAIATVHGGVPQPMLRKIVCGDLGVIPDHPDARVRDAIRGKVETEIASYAELLDNLVRSFRKPGMRPVFERCLAELKAEDLLVRIACFGVEGVDWRNVADLRVWQTRAGAPIEARKPSSSPHVGGTKRMTFGTVLGDDGPRRARISAQLEPAVKKRGIPRLVHFTRAANLESIVRHGLCSIMEAKLFELDPKVNDKQRLDGLPWGVSLSIASPNHKMFYKYRMLDQQEEWAVLLIDPAVLWKNDCAFYARNAADHRMRGLPSAGQKTLRAFEAMYEPLEGVPSREAQRLSPFDPTDPQAEVLVFDRIEPGLIQGVAFDSAAVRAVGARFIGTREARLYAKGKGPFGTREFDNGPRN
ncbi:DarT ssDNA thymidine ADP-ribosyltransferase family protein [Paraburkholderia sp. MM5477-R1]|uniref:DarT ssDNA thymidine ADP-ribosyltransferase family protein n=1 Tax=Paraburkholderia sp. MM5477-R1 TaxID=2991062 RepID=UPI003D1F5FB3